MPLRSLLFALTFLTSVYILLNALLSNSCSTISCHFRGVAEQNLNAFLAEARVLGPILLIDHDVLRAIAHGTNHTITNPIKFAINRSLKDELLVLNDTLLEFIYYERSDAHDYWIFTDIDGTKRTMLPFEILTSDFVYYPADIHSFLQDWEYSRFIECANVMSRPDNETRTIPLKLVSKFAELRDFIKHSDNAHLVACGGTLLGWYRECSLIPHTTDADFFIRSEEYSPKIYTSLNGWRSPYRLFRVYGLPSDSYELSITVRKVVSPRVNIDIFSLYTNANESWMGGLAWHTRQKYKWSYPRTTEICTGDLLGHLIYVPCNVEPFLEADYGNWSMDEASNNYTWYEAGNNVSPNGEFSESELRNMKPE